MTGSLQIKGDKFYTVIYVKDSSGKVTQKWKSTGLQVKGNRRRAEQILKERIAEYEKQALTITKDILFSDFMLEWLEIVKTQVKANTYHQYSLIIKNSIEPYFRGLGVKLQELQPIHIQRYYNKLVKDGLTGNTVKHHHANIHKALNYAMKANWILNNPADRIELPKIKRFIGNFYTDEQLKQVLKLMHKTNIETPVLLTATYGLRRSEAIGLKWDAIDFTEKSITILHTVVGNGKRMLCSDTTKTNSSTRKLPLLPHIEKHLIQVKHHQEAMQKILGKEYHKSDYICTWDNGRLIRPEYLSRRFKQLLQQSDLPVYRFHDLRHSAASLLIANGCSLKEVGEWLGHSSVSTTNIYAHLQFQSKISMGDIIGDKLFAEAN